MHSITIPNNLGEWANQPVVQDRVIAYMESIDAPMLLREIYLPLGLPRYTVNRVLGRLHTKGVLARHRIPVQCHRPVRETSSVVTDGAARQCFLYSFIEDDP